MFKENIFFSFDQKIWSLQKYDHVLRFLIVHWKKKNRFKEK